MVTATRNEHGRFVKQSGAVNGADRPPGENGNASIAGANPGENTGGGGVTVDPASIEKRADSGQPESGKRGPGRPAGSGKKPGEKPAQARPQVQGQLDLTSINFTLFYTHSVLAQVTKTPEFALTEQESEKLGTACMNVLRHYNINTSQKAIDWGNLLITGGLIYGSKVHQASERKKRAVKEKKESAQAVNAGFGIPPNVGMGNA